jgi:DNA-binding winged helix-turn-helix (wHTH) protein
MASEEVVRIEEFHFHLGLGELRHSSRTIPLEPRAAQVLAYLARNAGRIVSRAELLAAVWPRGAGSDGALSYSVRRLRQALGGRGRGAISTFRRHGYRLHAELARDSDDWDALEPHDLIERKAALTHLRTQFKGCSSRKQPALAIVTGMAGSGKTALLQGFRRELEQSGERALFTHGSELPAREQLERVAGRRALVVFVDDVQEAGARAIESLRGAATQGTRPIFFVAACRTPLSAARVQCLAELLRSARTLALDCCRRRARAVFCETSAVSLRTLCSNDACCTLVLAIRCFCAS